MTLWSCSGSGLAQYMHTVSCSVSCSVVLWLQFTLIFNIRNYKNYYYYVYLEYLAIMWSCISFGVRVLLQSSKNCLQRASGGVLVSVIHVYHSKKTMIVRSSSTDTFSSPSSCPPPASLLSERVRSHDVYTHT